MNLGDFDPVCPSELALLPSFRVALRMHEEYGSEEALRKARYFAAHNVEGSWGRKSWDFSASVMERLAASVSEEVSVERDLELPQFMERASTPPLPKAAGELKHPPKLKKPEKTKVKPAQLSLLDMLEES